MKKIIFILTFILLGVCSVSIAANKKYVRPFFFDENASHSYNLSTVQTFTGLNNNIYSISFYVDTNEWSMNDGFYSKIVIKKKNQIISELKNDNTWTKCRASKSSSEIAKICLISNDCIAVLLEGKTDFSNMPEITLLVINGNSASVVYNQTHEITSISESSDLTLMLQGRVIDYTNYPNFLTESNVKIVIGEDGVILYDIAKNSKFTIYRYLKKPTVEPSLSYL